MGYKIIRKYNIVVRTASDGELMPHRKTPADQALACNNDQRCRSGRRLRRTCRRPEIRVQRAEHHTPEPHDNVGEPEKRTVFEQHAQDFQCKCRHQSTP